MIKFLAITLLLLTTLMAKTYNFSEIRYSDALDKSMTLQGEITFKKDGLNIDYKQSKRALKYENGELEYLQDGELVEISEDEAMKIAEYFEIIILLYSGDKDALNAAFEVREEGSLSFLVPRGEIKEHITKIKLKRSSDKLQMIQLFLSNLDNITISIEDEVVVSRGK